MVEVPNCSKRHEVGPLQDHCGIMGVYYPNAEGRYFQEMLNNLEENNGFPFMALQTRGYDGAGFWTLGQDGTTTEHRAPGAISEAFSSHVLTQYADTPGRIVVLQNRYGTNGSASIDNLQPAIGRHFPTGEEVAVAHNGQFSLGEEQEIANESDTYVYLRELTQAEGDDWDQRIVNSLWSKRGAYSLIIGTSFGMYLARDPKGIRPLSYGLRPDGTWIAASETAALEMEGITEFLEVMPGEVVRIDDGGPNTVHKFETDGHTAACSFENVYVAGEPTRVHAERESPDQINHAITIYEMRRNSGFVLAREAPVTMDERGLVVGIPGTAIPGGEAYAEALGLTYRQIVKDRQPNNERTFMSADLERIYGNLLTHFTFDAESIEGRDITIVDDSIVRGNVSGVLVELLKTVYGAKSVHLRVLSPPIDKPCHLGVNTRTSEELIAARHSNNVDLIARELGVDSLGYLSVDGLIESITKSRTGKGLCTGCMAGGQHPIDRHGDTIPPVSTPVPPIRLYTRAHA